jgi:hypothetical protein
LTVPSSSGNGTPVFSDQAVVHRTLPWFLSDCVAAISAAWAVAPSAMGAVDPTLGRIALLLESVASTSLRQRLGVPGQIWNQLYLAPAVASLWSDFGLFSGDALRAFILQQLTSYQQELASPSGQNAAMIPADQMTIAQFNNLTKIAFVVSATNVTSGLTLLFNEKFPPNFPVADAITISASFPVIFKPTWIDQSVFGNVSIPDMPSSAMLQGYFADGGIADNFPLHAFDSFQYSAPSYRDYPATAMTIDSETLNPNTLGLQLVPGSGPDTTQTAASADSWNLLNYFEALEAAVTMQNDDGYVRSARERNQVVQIPSGWLATTDFSPSPAAEQEAQELAKAAMNDYFDVM